MNKKIIISMILVAVFLVIGYFIFYSPKATTPSINNSVVITETDSSLGEYLTDPNGNALYFYNSDTLGTSNCIDTCLTTWPIYQNVSSTSNLPTNIGVITRSDGSIQYTYKGMPLYYYTGDMRGNVTGNKLDNFIIATPSSSTQTTTTQTTNSSQTYSY